MRWDIINRLIRDNGYKTYLEIGVYHKPGNFDKIKCLNKTGVDPDPKVGATFKLTSDKFFAQNKKKFDIIFIDGLHHEEQVLRDVENSLQALAPNGTIVLHDCNPTTEAMQLVPRMQGEWTGDVWKAWVKLRSRADLSMFVFDIDYGVGVITKGEQTSLVVDNPYYDAFDVNRTEWLNLKPYTLPPLSICIPAFEQYGKGVTTLTALLESLKNQKGLFEVIVSDNSEGDAIKNVCDKYNVSYYHNPVRGVSANTNYAISKAKYAAIKVMYQDDLALSNDMVNEFAYALSFNNWVVSNGNRIDDIGKVGKPIHPVYTDGIINGKNTIGMPSVTGFIKPPFQFDTKLKTLLDCEFYWQLHKFYGKPYIIKKNLIGSRYWDYSTSRQQGNLTDQDYKYLQTKWPELK